MAFIKDPLTGISYQTNPNQPALVASPIPSAPPQNNDPGLDPRYKVGGNPDVPEIYVPGKPYLRGGNPNYPGSIPTIPATPYPESIKRYSEPTSNPERKAPSRLQLGKMFGGVQSYTDPTSGRSLFSKGGGRYSVENMPGVEYDETTGEFYVVKGFDEQGKPIKEGVNPTTGASTGVIGGGSNVDKAMADYLAQFPEPNLAKTKEEERAAVQSQIDAINQSFAYQLSKEAEAGAGRLGSERALAGRSGTLGSDFGTAQLARVETDVNKILADKKNQQALAVNDLLDKADQRAKQIYDTQRTSFLGSREAQLNFLKTKQSEAKDDFINIAKSGVIQSLDQLTDQDKELFKQQTGWDDFTLEATFNANKPSSQQIDWKQQTIGNTIVYSGIDPATGELKVLKKDLGVEIPQGYKTQVLGNGAILMMPEKIDPNIPLDQQITILGEGGEFSNKTADIQNYEYYAQQAMAQGETPMTKQEWDYSQANMKAKAEKAQIAGVDPAVANIAINMASKFDSSPIVKQFNEVQNKKLGVDRLLQSDQSGPGDVAMIYDFMKALDPTSVVRESEYAMGAKSGNIFTGALAQFNGMFKAKGGKLSPQVKKDFANILNQRYNSVKQQYNNLYDETSRVITATTGIQDPSMFLKNYEGAETTPTGDTQTEDLF